MPGIIQSVDVEVNLSGGQLDFPEVISVVDCEVSKTFGGAGSLAEIDVIFEELLTQQQKQQLRRSVPGATPNERFDKTNLLDFNENVQRRAVSYGVIPDDFITADNIFKGDPISVTVDVAITNQTPDDIEEHSKRIFTGTVTKVVENNERIVTFEAMNKRYELNRNMVYLDIGEEGATTDEIIRNVLSGTDSRGNGMGLVEGEDYIIDLGDVDPEERSNVSWGINNNETVYNVLQNLAYHEGAALHIDSENVIHFTRYPDHSYWEPDTMPPIVDWESGDEETEKDVIVESKYDESGLGIFSPMSSTPNTEQPVDNVGSKVELNNVFSRKSVDKARVSELVDRNLMLDSGILHCLGDPKIEPFDELLLDENAVDGFSAITKGEYMVKEVTHMISGDTGYIIELEIGTNPRELIEEFTGNAGGVYFREWQEEVQKAAEEEASSFSIVDAIKFVGNTVIDTLNPF